MDHPLASVTNAFVENGKPAALTALSSIGEFVVRILQDSRTLNKSVLAWDWISTQKNTWTIAETITGEDFSDYPRVSLAASLLAFPLTQNS